MVAPGVLNKSTEQNVSVLSLEKFKINKATILALKTNKMGLKKASGTFDMPKDSLRRRLQKLEISNSGDNTDIIHKQLLGRFGNVLSESEEEELKKYITDVDKACYG